MAVPNSAITQNGKTKTTMSEVSMNEKVDEFFAKLGEGFPREASRLRELVSRACDLGLRPQTGKNETNLHLKDAQDVNFGCFMSNGRFRNFSSRLTGERFVDDLGRILGFRVSKEGSDHWWTVCEEGSKSIPLDDFLAFENEWLDLVADWIRENACNFEKDSGKSQGAPL